jgi:hypothetical protein
MAKQSFSVGQVLTAAQMNSLQQTAMLGGSATAKTASYTLVATDAGTVVSVNSTSATTITVNTALFSAGDTVTIQNWGSGAVTITAGTATVNTAGSLIVPQYDGGVLYFTSASAAIYFDFVQAGAVSPLTTKGDLYGFGSSDARIPIGTNGHILTADSAETLGLKWAAPAGGGSALTLIKRSTFTDVADTSTTFDSIFTSTYKAYQVVIERLGSPVAPDREARMQLFYSGTLQTADYLGGVGRAPYTGSLSVINNNISAQYVFANQIGSSNFLNSYVMWFNYVGNASECANWYGLGYQGNTGDGVFFGGGTQTPRTYTGFQIKASSGNITGTISIYGLATS